MTTPSRADVQSSAPATTTTTTTTFPPPTGAQLVRALRAAVVGYGWLLVGAVAMTVLILVAANIGSTGEATGVESDDTNALGVLVGMPFQLAAMALLGSIHITEDGVSGSLFLPPLLLTAWFVVMTARSAGRGEVVPAAGTRALLGVAVGFVTAVVVTPLTWALAMRTQGTSVHAASAGLFFGTWVLTGVASYAGSSRRAGASRPAWLPDAYLVAARVWAGSVAAWVAVSLVVTTVVAAVQEGLWAGILSPLWGGTTGLWTYAVGHFGGLSAVGQGVTMWDLQAYWVILLIVGALVLGVLTSIAWRLRRGADASSLAQPQSWLALPTAYLVGGVLVWLVPSVVVSGGLGGFGGAITVRPTLWSILVLILWGGAVEAASRFVAPSLAQAVPARLHALLRGPERKPVAADATVPEPVESRPLTPEEKSRYKRIGILTGALALLVLAGWIAVSVINGTVYSPENQAKAYLDAVADGDLDEATDLAPTDDDQGDDGLLTSEVYKGAENRITGYELGDVKEDGDTVTVDVTLKGLGSSDKTQLTLARDGRTGVLFDKWKVDDGGLARLVSISTPDSAGDLTVNDVPVDSVDSDVWLLPGDYAIDPFAGNQWLEGSGEPVTVTADGSYQMVDVSSADASDAFKAEVQRQLDAYLSDCMASTELEPEGCPNDWYAGSDVRNVKWTMDSAPTPDFDSFDGTFPADLGYGDSGQATVSYESDESYGFGPPDWQPYTEQTELYLSSIVVTQEGDGLKVTIDG